MSVHVCLHLDLRIPSPWHLPALKELPDDPIPQDAPLFNLQAPHSAGPHL